MGTCIFLLSWLMSDGDCKREKSPISTIENHISVMYSGSFATFGYCPGEGGRGEPSCPVVHCGSFAEHGKSPDFQKVRLCRCWSLLQLPCYLRLGTAVLLISPVSFPTIIPELVRNRFLVNFSNFFPNDYSWRG
jgi:hypothetical protein